MIFDRLNDLHIGKYLPYLNSRENDQIVCQLVITTVYFQSKYIYPFFSIWGNLTLVKCGFTGSSKDVGENKYIHKYIYY